MKLTTLIIILFLSTTAIALSANQQLTVNILPGGIDLQIHSPKQDDIFNKRQVPLNITFGQGTIADSLKFSDNKKSPRTLCRNCKEYSKSKSFTDGMHELEIIATHDVGTVISKFVNFTVDSKAPKIIKTEPRRGFTTGVFNVEFREENPTSLILTYGNSTIQKQLNLTSECTKQRSKTNCSSSVNLSQFNGKKIHYFFNLTDIAGSSDSSRPNTLSVDLTPPKINLTSLTIKRRRVTFKINITETNLDEVGYIDSKDRSPRFRRLCSRLNNNQCIKSKSFSRGNHSLQIIAKDDAGNTNSVFRNFTIS